MASTADPLPPIYLPLTTGRVLTAYNVALGKASKLMRQLLRRHHGYECKEPEPGKLTLAFRHLEDALDWGCALQAELLGFAWPDTGGWEGSVGEWVACAGGADVVCLDCAFW